MPIIAKKFKTQLDQLNWVANEISNLIISQKVEPSQIAVIARKHEHLMNIVPVLDSLMVPVSYERGQNVLEKKEILELIAIFRFVDSLNQVDEKPKEELLPQILCFEFWRLSSQDIYLLSEKAYKDRQSWLLTMQNYENSDFKLIADFLIELGKQAKVATLEQIIDEVTGISKQDFNPSETSEEIDRTIEHKYNYDPEQGKINILTKGQVVEKSTWVTNYISPYKWYYFDREQYQNGTPDLKDNPKYLTFLSALKTFIDSIRNYKSGQTLYLKDLIEFVDLLQARKIRVVDNSPYNSASKAVSLLTAHKSKGLEFEYVFVLDCVEDAWNGRGISNKIGLPSNLALLPQSENTDDALRLLFVALTRAKTHLYLNTYQYGKDSKEMQVLSFLADLVRFEEHDGDSLEMDADQKQDSNNVNSPLIVWFEAALNQVSPDFNLKDYLRYSLENYKLSVTHLNNFLDLVRGGPKRFLEQNLLRFPQTKSPNAAYGTAMHAAITDFYSVFKRVGALPESEVLVEKFEISLKSQRLNQQDTLSFLKKGIENLRLYHQDQKSNFNLSDRLEEDFASQGVVLFKHKDDLNNGNESLNETARITGKIDKLKFNTLGEGDGVKIIEVVDFKTGKNHSKWSDSTLDVQVKLQNYRRQLVFYKLLVENSRDFGKYKVNTGSLEFLDLPQGKDKIVILNTEISDLEAVELSKLIQVVYKKIINLDFPDISKYEPNLKGIEEFIQDLLAEF